MIADALLDLRQVAITAYDELNVLAEIGGQAGHRLDHVMNSRPRSDTAHEAQT
jgi:hypothetical protein